MLKNILFFVVLISSCKSNGEYRHSTIDELNRYLFNSTNIPWPGELERIEKLIDLGAEIDYVDEYTGNTPFLNTAGALEAAKHEQFKYGANRDTIEAEALKIVSFLQQSGANIFALQHSERKLNALHLAAIGGRAKMINLLVQMGMDVNLKSADGKTALIYACAGGDLNSVKACISSGALTDIKTPNGNTALDWAEYIFNLDFTFGNFLYNQHNEILIYLKSLGASNGEKNFN